MKTLKIGDSYKYRSFTLEVTARENNIVFAENEAYGIEVFKIRNRKESTFPDGHVSAGGEYPPITTDWGNSSGYWKSSSREHAVKYFNELVARGTGIKR